MYVIDINYSCLPKRYVPYDSLPLQTLASCNGSQQALFIVQNYEAYFDSTFRHLQRSELACMGSNDCVKPTKYFVHRDLHRSQIIQVWAQPVYFWPSLCKQMHFQARCSLFFLELNSYDKFSIVNKFVDNTNNLKLMQFCNR